MARPPLDLRAVANAMPMTRVLALLGHHPRNRSGRRLRYDCPAGCPAHRRSAPAVVLDRVIYCHECHWRGDGIQLWAWVHRLPVLDAAYELCQITGITPPLLRR